ncbi:MAG: UDP-N-acetylmuramate dehydrogenase [Phycisphaerae bacterium]|nr:UDP-N-acetylmuramate dehydrogenase [Phycisphaerae bacterium]
MTLFADLENIVKRDEPMAGHTWFRLGGPAKYYIEPNSPEQLKEVVKRCRDHDVDVYVLGRGSNLLIADAGIDGAVVRLSDPCFSKIRFDDNKVYAGAGVNLSTLLTECAKKGFTGLECLAGIPGSVGGAVRINAGGSFGDIGNVCESVTLMDSSGYTFTRSKGDILFGYRTTNILARFVLEAELQLMSDDPERIAKMIKEVWMLKKSSQPMNSRNAGCIFKNPRAISAGALIDKAGLKGARVGGACVSHRHANFIMAEDGCTATDVMQLIETVQNKVKDRFDIDLELELEIWQ